MTRKSGRLCLIAPLALLVTVAYPSHGGESRWIRLRSAHFEMYSSAGAGNARDTIREFEQVRGFFVQAVGGPPARPIPVRLVSFGSAKEYEPYRINEFAVAYYHQTADRDYIVMSHGGADTFPIAVHEYVHLLVRHFGLKLPPWFNEGLAELYSTLRPFGGKIVVGALIPGRHRALLEEKWVPLATILAADHQSPYYNEKNKAGSLYNEGWALTHMLKFRPEYRPKFGELMRSISGGEDSAEALRKVYGKTVQQVDRDLQAYLTGGSFQGELVEAKLEKAGSEFPVESLGEFDAGLMFADLAYRPGREAAQQATLEKLARQDPKRPEPCRGLGYLAWRAGRHEEAAEQFGKAYERGDHDAKLLWDYGRLLERDHGEEAIRMFTELLAQDAERMDARLELAEAQLRANRGEDALETLSPVHKVAPAEAARYFRIAVYAHLQNGQQKYAEQTAQHFREVATTDEDRAAAELLVKQAAPREHRFAAAPAMPVEGEEPRLQRAAPIEEAKSEPRSEPPSPPERPSVAGRFVELDCREKKPRMIVETGAGRKVFLIEDPGAVAIVAGSEGPVDMTCGVQKTPVKVEVGYDKPAAGQAGITGVVRTLAF